MLPGPGFLTSETDTRLGGLPIGAGDQDDRRVPVWMSAEQFGYWPHTQLTIDVVPVAAPDSPWRLRPVAGS